LGGFWENFLGIQRGTVPEILKFSQREKIFPGFSRGVKGEPQYPGIRGENVFPRAF